ncbi:MAG: hypothetical protein ACAI25_13115 [Planctomycetota bacterium]
MRTLSCSTLLRSTLLLSVVLVAGCACPPSGRSDGGRSSGDPSGGTFAFLGGLKCFFGADEAKEETRPAKPEDLTTKDEADHAAALTIR